MTITTEAAPPPPGAPETDRPRSISQRGGSSDLVFANVVRVVGWVVTAVTGAIGVFLALKLFPTIKLYGFKFFTGTTYNPQGSKDVGILGALTGTAQVALIAVCVGFPLALMTALYISEYAPNWLKPTLVSIVDLMAAVPSIIFGLWGALALSPELKYVARWLSQHFGWIPLFHVPTDPNAAQWAQSVYTGNAFTAGVTVGMMIVPMACSVMRSVFVLAPIGEREAALALGSTRWGMIRTVVLPFGRGGIIGGTMLGLGRALGETIAVLLIISQLNGTKWSILSSGTKTVSWLIANNFGESTGTQKDALLALGFVLFVLTLFVNTVAAIFVSRSRSGAGT